MGPACFHKLCPVKVLINRFYSIQKQITFCHIFLLVQLFFLIYRNYKHQPSVSLLTSYFCSQPTVASASAMHSSQPYNPPFQQYFCQERGEHRAKHVSQNLSKLSQLLQHLLFIYFKSVFLVPIFVS